MPAEQETLDLDEAQSRTLTLATRHANASAAAAIPDTVLLRALRTGIVPPGYEHHVFAVLDETDTATLADLAISGAVSYRALAALADRLLRGGHPTRAWLDERAEAAIIVAAAAEIAHARRSVPTTSEQQRHQHLVPVSGAALQRPRLDSIDDETEPFV